MKTKIAFLAVVLTFAIIRMYGQSVPEESSMYSKSMIPSAPPTFETTTSGLEIKVWVMTAEEHKKAMEANMNSDMNKDMKKDKSKDMSMNKSDKNMSMAMKGTHHIRVDVSNSDNGEARNDLSAKVEVKSPSNKSSWVDLKNMSDHYGNDLNLNEKGQYTFIINLNDKGMAKSTRFNYTVQ